MKTIAILICAVTAATAFSFTSIDQDEWNAFKMEHQKHYDTEQEELHRMKVYAENKRKIAKHNEMFARGLVTYTQKLNKYSDLTHHEFSSMQGHNENGNNAESSVDHENYVERFDTPAIWDAPAEMDWRKLGAVTDVKDQGSCDAGWAFSAAGAVEGQQFLQTNRLVTLSEQNLIDCTWNYGNRGCKGGRTNKAFVYIKDNEGIDTEESYPYEGQDRTCRFNPSEVGAFVTGYAIIPKNETKLLAAVANVGPVAAYMHGSLDSFRDYGKGVYDDSMCTDLLPRNHGVLIVGYGTDEEGGDYWLIKNSWGASWGMDGYAMIARNRNNLCGIASDTSYPIM